MTLHHSDPWLDVHQGDCRAVLRELDAGSVHCVVTSPPYWGLRDYGTPGQLGLEATPEAYIVAIVDVFREIRRVLRDDGTVWLNLGDTFSGKRPRREVATSTTSRRRDDAVVPRSDYAVVGLKEKDLVGIPWAVAFALRADGWWLRRDIIWSKPNPMPESVTDRPTSSHEYLFLLTKSPRYYYDAEAVRQPATSGPSDLRKMAEGLDRLGGRTRELDDPLLAGSKHTNVGRKRSVGGRPLKQDAGAQIKGGDRSTGFNDRWAARGRRPSGWVDSDDGSALGRYGTDLGGPSTLPPGRNLRSVWTIATEPYPGAHFATFPRKLVEPCILAGCPPDGVVLDPFAGSGTVAVVAQALSRRAILIDLNTDYLDQALARNRAMPLGL